MSNSMLQTGDIWLSEAVELVAATRWPIEWNDYQLSAEEADDLAAYEEAEARYAEYLRVKGGPIQGLAGLETGSFTALAIFGHPPEKPDQTIVVFNADHKKKLRQKLLLRAWTELRRALVDGRISARCMMALEPNVTIPSEEWGKDANHSAHRNRTVFLGLSPSTGKPRYGKAFLSRDDVLAWLTPENNAALASRSDQVIKLTGKRVRTASTSALARALASAQRFMSEKGYSPLTKTEAQDTILRSLFENASRDMIREATKSLSIAKRRPPRILANREQEISDCREAVKAAIIIKKDK